MQKVISDLVISRKALLLVSLVAVILGAMISESHSLMVTDESANTEVPTYLSTSAGILALKWTKSNLATTYNSPLISDIDGDGKDDVLFAGVGIVTAYRGTDASVIWSKAIPEIGEWVQPQMADINKDGSLEIIVPLRLPGGVVVLRERDGSILWKRTDLGGLIFSSPVIGDIDGSGYPTIFVASEDTEQYPNGTYRLTGRLTSLDHNGNILHQTFAWRPCAGGLSLGDTDNDGKFELYMGDRSEGYPDGGYGRGVRSFWAQNLSIRWERPDILSSSHIPMLVDVNHDGKMEVIAGNQRGGLFILNALNGNTIRSIVLSPDTIPQHYQPSIYDVDGDGNLEIMLADGDHSYGTESNFDTPDIVIWDLVQWKVDHRMNIGLSRFPPQIGEVTGDGRMDIVVANYSGLFVFDPTFSWITPVDKVAGLVGTLSYPVFGDIDGDGLNEIVIAGTHGRLYTFDTPGLTPNPRPRSEVQFYSERRLGAAEYIPIQGRAFVTSFSVNPSLFSPNGDGILDTTKITATFTVSMKWILEIRNTAGFILRTWTGTGTAVSLIWDGKDEAGVIVPSSTYNFRLSGTTLEGNSFSVESRQVTVDTQPPTILGLTVYPASFHLRKDKPRISYTLSETCRVTIKIYDSTGAVTRVLLNGVLQSPGYNSVTWNGKNDLGRLVPRGTYTIKVYCADLAGNKGASYPAITTVTAL